MSIGSVAAGAGKQCAPAALIRRCRAAPQLHLSGTWSGYRSSRLNVQYRVIYRVVSAQQLFQVIEVTPHDYRKR